MPRQRASIASAFRERKLPMEEKKELLDQDERVVEIELERLRGFVNHPFKVQADSQMIELQESIKKYGILNPLIVRPRQDGTYEIISGHRRKFAAEKIGYRNPWMIDMYEFLIKHQDIESANKNYDQMFGIIKENFGGF